MKSRKDFIRNTVMAIAATLLPKTLLPIDVQGLHENLERRGKYRDESMYQITYDGEHGNYTYFASGKILNAMDREFYRMWLSGK